MSDLSYCGLKKKDHVSKLYVNVLTILLMDHSVSGHISLSPSCCPTFHVSLTPLVLLSISLQMNWYTRRRSTSSFVTILIWLSPNLLATKLPHLMCGSCSVECLGSHSKYNFI